ncbi:MAG: hypothetical protein IJX55_02630 [Clostridia bacterium]|nr:hypothetical protein [Clostridia bacterium]
MKNNAKRLLAFLLAALLCVTMVVPAFATEADAEHDHDHKVSCDADCTHECETNHENSEVIEVVKSVCTAAGYTLKYCFDCEHYFVADVVPAEEGAAHNPGDKVAEGKAATCVSEGVETSYKCTVCGALCDKDGGEVDTLDVIDHEYKDGLCVICGKHEDDSCVGEHVWEFVEVTVEATATTNGTATYKCTVCGAKKEVVIKATSGEAERIYPSSIYVDIDFVNGVAADRLENATVVLKGDGAKVEDTELTYNGVKKTFGALKVSAKNSYGLVTLTKLDTIDKMNDFLAGGFSVEALYIDNANTNAVQGVVCATQWVNASKYGHGWGIASTAKDLPYFLTGHGNGYNVVNIDSDTAETIKLGDLIHVVATYDPVAGTNTIYVNGVKAGSVAASTPKAPNTNFTGTTTGIFNAFFLGADVSVNQAAPDYPATDMTIVDAKIYGSALTAEEVKMLHGYVVEDFTEKEVVDELAWVKEILAEKNLSIEDYDVLTLDTQLAGYYNSNSATLSTIVTKPGDAFTSSYWCTKTLYTAEDIPAGSILLVKEGYQYRPEGWVTLDTQNTGKNGAPARPANVTDEFTVVGADFWSTFAYRSFNISRVVAKDEAGNYIAMTEEDLGAFVILTPKTHTCGKDTLTKVDAVAGTCTEKGTIAHYECSCGKLYSDAEATKEITSIEGDFGHTYGEEPTEKQAATCTKYGYELWACTKCGDVSAKNIAPKGHATVTDTERHLAGTEVVTVLPSCKVDGSQTWTCECGEKQTTKLAATGCDLVTVEVAATCSTFAFKYTYCKNVASATHKGCDETKVSVPEGYFATETGKYVGEKVNGVWVATNVANVVAFEITGNTLDATNHFHVVTGEVSTPSNCKEEGTKVDYCLGCHALDKSYTYGPEGHDYGEETLVSDATCTAAAQYKKVCTICGHIDTYAKGEALGHKYGDVQTTPATCAAKGEKYKVCTVCGDKEVVEVLEFKSSAVDGIYADYETAAKEHVLVGGKENYRPGDCLNVGLDKYTCEKCGDVFVQTGVGGEGHVVGEIKGPAVAPTCTTGGNTAGYICSACGKEVESIKLAALGHDLEEVVAKEETCTEDGDVAHFHCDTCGKNFTTAEATEEITTAVVIPATGHNYVAGVCTNCNEKCVHVYKPIDSNVASCDKDALYDGYGFTHFECSECGDEYWTNFVVTPAHDYEEGKITVTPNCTTKGEKADVCTECGEKVNVVVLPETHYNAEEEAIIDSCIDTTEDRVCVVCKETIGKSHNPVTTKVNNTCKELGYTITACGDCGEVLETVANAEFGDHVYGEPVIVDSTYAAEGTKTEVCTVCGYNKVTTIEKKSGLNIKLEVTNKYNFKDYVDGSYVVVKVLADANNVNAWSFKFTLGYNETVLNYVKEESAVATTICDTTTSGLINAENGVAKVLGYASNDADAKMQNVVLNGEDIVLATLVFRVDSDVEVSDIAFTVDEVEIVNKTGDDVDEALGADLTVSGATISTQLYLDINNDGVIDLEDLNSMAKIMANEVPADSEIIEAAADANHDGTIGEADLSILLNALVK